VNAIIRNTYRTLMTRGMKGCYIYCTDPETSAYFRERIVHPYERPVDVERRMVADQVKDPP